MGTVTKALSLLDHFNVHRRQIGLSDMARLAGQNKATTYRMLTELQQKGFVEQAGKSREYRLGPALIRLAALREQAVPIREISDQIVRDLSDKTRETVHVTLLSGQDLQLISYAYSSAHGTGVTMEDAQIIPLHTGSSGLAVLAFAATDFVDDILSQPLDARTEFTITDPEALRALLPGIRERGHASYMGGFERDVHSLAAPIFNGNARVIGAISVASPVARLTPDRRDEIAALVCSHAAELTNLTGGSLPAGYPLPERTTS